MEKMDEIKTIIDKMESDVKKFETKGIDAAAVRLRSGLAEVSKLCKAARQEIQEIRNNPKE